MAEGPSCRLFWVGVHEAKRTQAGQDWAKKHTQAHLGLEFPSGILVRHKVWPFLGKVWFQILLPEASTLWDTGQFTILIPEPIRWY